MATVSVILPFYNAEKTLSAAIESILKQTYSDFELILVDNNSTDKSGVLAKTFVGKDARLICINEGKQGVANAMNCGLCHASGKYIARMDADDISMPNRLEKQLRFLEDNPETGVVGCAVEYIPQKENTEGFQRFVNWVNSFHTVEEIEFNRFVEIPIVNPTIFFRREIFENYGTCFDGDFPEDYEMQLRYLEAGVKMAKLPEPLLKWYDYSTRLTRTDERYATKAFYKLKSEYFRLWSEKNNPFHPHIWVWGAGRKTRQRVTFLEKVNLIVDGFIDIRREKTTRKTTIHYSKIPAPGNRFIVPMVTNTGARVRIKNYLLKKKYVEGVDFISLG